MSVVTLYKRWLLKSNRIILSDLADSHFLTYVDKNIKINVVLERLLGEYKDNEGYVYQISWMLVNGDQTPLIIDEGKTLIETDGT